MRPDANSSNYCSYTVTACPRFSNTTFTEPPNPNQEIVPPTAANNLARTNLLPIDSYATVAAPAPNWVIHLSERDAVP